jgi:hypothetical protein
MSFCWSGGVRANFALPIPTDIFFAFVQYQKKYFLRLVRSSPRKGAGTQKSRTASKGSGDPLMLPGYAIVAPTGGAAALTQVQRSELCQERTNNEVTEPCRLRRGEGYEVCEDALKGLGVFPNKILARGASALLAKMRQWVPPRPACYSCIELDSV